MRWDSVFSLMFCGRRQPIRFTPNAKNFALNTAPKPKIASTKSNRMRKLFRCWDCTLHTRSGDELPFVGCVFFFFCCSLYFCCSSLRFVRDYRLDVRCKMQKESRNKMFIFGVFGHRVRNQKANHNCSNIVLLHHPTLTLSLCAPSKNSNNTFKSFLCGGVFVSARARLPKMMPLPNSMRMLSNDTL